MKCGKKKVKKFSEGGWSTSVSFDPEDAARRVAEYSERLKKQKAEEAPAPVAKEAPAPARPALSAERAAMRGTRQAPPKLETITVSAKRQKGPSNEVAAKVASGLPARRGYRLDDSEPMARADRSLRRGRSFSKMYAKGGGVRGDGCCKTGKTKGKMC